MLEVAGDLHQVPTKFENPAVGLIAQLVEYCTGIAQVMGLNPIQAWIFLQALILQLLKLCI